MRDRIRNFFSAPVFEGNPEKTQDAGTTHRVSIALLFLAVFSIPLIFLLESPIRELALTGTAAGFFLWLFSIHLVKTDKLSAAKTIILAVNTLNLFGVVYAVGGLGVPAIFTALFLLALANLLFPRRGAIVYGALLLSLAAGLYALDQANLTPAPALENSARTIFLTFTFTLISVAGILAIASGNFRRNLEAARRNEAELRERNLQLDQLQRSLEERVNERTAQLKYRAGQLEAIASVARSTASLQNIEELLPAVAQLVSDRFGFYHVGIFLVDEKQEFAELRASNSEGGRRMLERHHRLRLDTNSIVGFATSSGKPRIALDVGTDAVFFNNPDLPKTRSEMALPLRIGGRVIGALDVQSTQPNAFTDEDISTISTLADQISIAIENANLLSGARAALKEAEETFARYVKQEWSSFASQMKNTGYLFDGTRTIPLVKREKAKNIAQTGRLLLEKDLGKITVPIKFRGQTIGVLDIQSKSGTRKWTQDDLTLLEAAADRAALALENARLVETSQQRAARERTIGEISTKIGALSDVEAIMQTAVEELGRRIGGATEVTIEFGEEGF